jgi:DNA repair exonuclease SbcCD ATPase subunit
MIIFEKISWKNMLSTGNAGIEIDLRRSPTTLIVGENGAGKSTILDAICFALFNRGFRDVSKPQLLNSINQKNLEVELKFSIGNKVYKLIRGHKPARFEIYCNDHQLNQEADSRDFQKYLEEHILKLNYKSFTQIVILGSASFTPFMQLPPSHRREIIEDLLDIRIFSVMNTILKDKGRELADRMRQMDADIEVHKEKVKLQDEFIRTLKQSQEKRSADVDQRIATTEEEINQHLIQIDLIKAEITALQANISDAEKVYGDKDEMFSINKQLRERVNKTQADIKFYHEHDNCPTCDQALTEELKTKALAEHSARESELQTAMADLETQLASINAKIDNIVQIQQGISQAESKLINYNHQVIAGQKYIQKLQEEKLQDEDDTGNLDDEKMKLRAMAREVMTMASEKTNLNEEKYYQDIAASLLKDTGIKTKIIRQYLPAINKLVNKYLGAMDFFVSFELDEAFNETIKSRHRDDFTYASFSEGEKQRIDLALLFTWRTIAKMKNSASTNLLLLDEVFDSSLDHNATDYLMNILNTLGEDTNVFVISHKGDILFDKFRSVIKFEKFQNFSRIARG